MVTLEALMQAGVNEDEAKRIMELVRQSEPEQEPTEPEQEPTEPEQEPAEPAQEPVESEQESTEPEQEPTEPAQEPVEPEQEPTEPEQEPAEPETPPAEAAPTPDYAAENTALRARLIESELRAAGMAAGVRPERLRTLARLADTSQVDVTAENAAQQIAEAVATALKEVPELAATPFAAGSLGAHPRESSRLADPFARGLMGQ